MALSSQSPLLSFGGFVKKHFEYQSPPMHAAQKICRSVGLAVACTALLACSSVWAQSAAVQSFPNKPIRVIIPFVAGGSGDTVVRLMGTQLTASLGQQVILDNRAGGSGVIGLQAAMKSAPDGYTLVLGTASTHSINPLLQADLGYDAVKDFSPVAMMIVIPNVLVAHPSVPASSLKELIALAKSKPGQLNFASNGNGTSSHMAGELLNLEAGIKIGHIPYKGAGQAINDVLGGHVPLLIGALATTGPHVASGKLKALGVTSTQRSAASPNTPTFSEGGLPGFEVSQWFGLFGPPNMPLDLLTKLNTEINRALNHPDVKNELTRQGFTVDTRTREEFSTYMKSESTKWARVIKSAGIRGE